MLKETKTIISRGLATHIEIIAFWENGLEEEEHLDEDRKVIRLKLYFARFAKKAVFRMLSKIEFITKTILYYKGDNIQFVNCHSILVLPIGVILKKMGVANILIYDTHELETETVGLKGFYKKILKYLERKFIKHCDTVICVCEPIAEWYIKEYNLSNVNVIRNMPINTEAPILNANILKSSLGIESTDLLVIYQGALISGRGISELIHTFKDLKPNINILFMGYGALENEVKEACNGSSNIYFHQAVPMNRIIEYTSSADIGIIYVPGEICLSYQLSLPNKFYEYMLAEIPVIISDTLVYMKQLISQNNLGWVVSKENSISSILSNLSITDYNSKKDSIKKYKKDIGWHIDEPVFDNVFRINNDI